MPTSLRSKRSPLRRSRARAAAVWAPVIGLLGVAAIEACSAGGADPSFWDPGGTPVPPGAGGAGSSGSSTTTTSGPNGPSASSSTGPSTTVSSSTTTTTTTTASSSSSSGHTSSSSSSSTGTTTTTTSSSAVASSSAAASSSSSGGPTWTELYNTIFGPSGTSTCTGSSCHSSSRSGFSCGKTAAACCQGLINAGYVTQGSGASSSALVDPSQSCLCGVASFGNMPKGYSCVTSAQLTEIKAWLATGAPCN